MRKRAIIATNPDELVERHLSNLDRMRKPKRTPTGEDAAGVDHSSARLLVEQAIREAWTAGAVFGQSIAAPSVVVRVEEPVPRIIPVPVYPEGWLRR